MGPSGAGDQCVCGVNGSSPAGPVGLIAAGPTSSLPISGQKPQAVSQGLTLLALWATQAPLHLGHVHAAGGQGVTIGQ